MQVVKLIVFSILALDSRMKRIQTHAHWRQFLLGSTFCSCYLPEPVGRSYFERSNIFMDWKKYIPIPVRLLSTAPAEWPETTSGMVQNLLLRMMYYSVSGTGIIEKKKTDCFMGQTSCILLGLECHVWHTRNGINVMEYFWAWRINENGVLLSKWHRHNRKKRNPSAPSGPGCISCRIRRRSSARVWRALGVLAYDRSRWRTAGVYLVA